VLVFALAVLPVGLLLWLTFVKARRRLAEQPICSLKGIVLTEIVALKDDVLVGYRGGYGSWFTVDPVGTTTLRISAGLRDVEGQLLLPALVRDAGAMKLLYQWCDQHTPLVSLAFSGQRLELTDPSGRHAVVAELSLTR
jgi:hypothetical protein